MLLYHGVHTAAVQQLHCLRAVRFDFISLRMLLSVSTAQHERSKRVTRDVLVKLQKSSICLSVSSSCSTRAFLMRNLELMWNSPRAEEKVLNII